LGGYKQGKDKMRIFSETEIRIIGCLIEKEITTPEQYPLTLNALTTACNQKSNRDPVTSLTDSDVLDSVNALIQLMKLEVIHA